MATIAGDAIVDPSDRKVIDRILATIRGMESGGNYQQLNKTATASGAYQYVNGTWVTKSKAVSGANSYPRAYQAPPSVQDAVAEADVRAILSATGNHLAAVPVMWYYPISWPPREGTNKGEIDYTPPGNPLTVRQYAEAWLKRYYSAQIIATGSGGVQQGLPNPVKAVKDAVNSATSMLEVVKQIFSQLSSMALWIRILKVIGGLIAIGMGLWIVTHEQPIQAGKALVGKAATVAAVA